ncbi:GTPase Obg [Spiroplasma sp. JKS002670]|nr:hypothetical protein [Spiroplasma sp. JKS002670]MCL8209603.1 GTPase Obg [Spiroplasma sp. JKS002670]
MKFIDLIKLKVKAGKGGDGIIAFRRELYVPKILSLKNTKMI